LPLYNLPYTELSHGLQMLTDKIRRTDTSHILVWPISIYSVTQSYHVISFEYILQTMKLSLVCHSNVSQ